MKPYILLAIMIVSFIAVTVLGTYFLFMGNIAPEPGTQIQEQPTPTPSDATAGWNVYRNDSVGFELKYPNNFFDAGHIPALTGAVACNYQSLPEQCPDVNELVGSLAGIPRQAGNKINSNGVDYCQYEIGDAATGHQYYVDYYAAVKNNTCLTVSIETSTTTCENYLPLQTGNTQQEQNYNDCIAQRTNRPTILQQIVNTFTFTQ